MNVYRIGLYLCCLLLLSGIMRAQQYNESNDFSYALKLYNEGFYDIAAQQFSSFINRYPASEKMGDARYYYADSFFKLGDIENARVEFQGLAVGFPDHPRAAEGWFRVGDCYHKLGKPLEAAKAYETVKILYAGSPLAPRGLVEAARLLLQNNELPRAEQIMKEFLDRYVDAANYPAGRSLYGRILLAKGESERAVAEFVRVPELTDDADLLAEALLGQANACGQLGLLPRATGSYEKILSDYAQSPSALAALQGLVDIRLAAREYEPALAAIRRQASGYAGGSNAALAGLLEARVLFLQKDFFAARKKLEGLKTSAAADKANDQLRRYYLACSYYEEKNYAAARPLLEELLREESGSLQSVLPLNLTLLYLAAGDLAAARSSVQRTQELLPGSADAEHLHQLLVKKAFQRSELSVGVDELQRFRGAFPKSNQRDDLIFLAGKAWFKAAQYQRSLLYFEQVLNEYPASARWDSSRTYIDFIQSYHSSGERTGVRELARLMGRILTGEDRSRLIFELGEIYINDLKDFQAAADIFSQPGVAAGDSVSTGKRLYYLSESLLKQQEYRRFTGQPDNGLSARVAAELKNAMAYVNYVPHPDTLTWRFLSNTLDRQKTPIDKYLQLWSVFETKFHKSPLLPEVLYHLAQTAMLQQKPTIAATYLERLISAAPGSYYSGMARVERGKQLLKEGKRDAGERQLKDFLLASSGHPLQAEAYWLLSQSSRDAGDAATSAKFLEELLAQFDYSDFGRQAPAGIIENYILVGDYQSALSYVTGRLRESGTADPVANSYLSQPDAAFYFFAGKAYYQQKEYASARKALLAYLERAQAERFQNESLFLLGSMAWEEQDSESALLHYGLLKPGAKDPFFPKAAQAAGDILFQQGRYEEALQRYKLLESLPPSPEKAAGEAYAIRCLIQLGRDSEAQKAVPVFEKTYSGLPGYSDYPASFEFEKGKKAWQEKSYDRAINHQKNVLKRYKSTSYADDAKYFIARCYTTMNRSKDALKTLDEFQKEFPNSDLLGNVFLTLAEINFRDEQEDAGLQAVRRANEIAATPDVKRSAMALLINTYHNMSLWDGALKTARDYIREFPNAEDVQSKKISVGIFLARSNRYSEAIDYLRSIKFEVKASEEPEVQFYIGEALYNSGQYEQAINEFLKIPLLSQKTKLQWEATALYYAGQSYERLNRPRDAVRMYEEIMARPGIQVELKREARKLIDKLNGTN